MKKALFIAFFFLLAFGSIHATKQVSLKAGVSPPYSEADTEPDAVVLQGVPGMCYTLNGEIQNNLSSTMLTKDLDLVFILDASGSMQPEINSVKDSIEQIISKINSTCPGCMRVGLYAFESLGNYGSCVTNKTGFTTKPYCDGSNDIGAIHLSTDSSNLKTRLRQVCANGSIEPWASLTKEILEDSSWGWRNDPDVVKAILVITDEPADPCQSCDSDSCHGYKCTEAGQALLSKDAYFFGIVGAEGSYSATAKTNMDTILGISKKGKYYDYTDTSKIPDLILQAIYSIIGADTFKIERVSGENWGGIVQGTTIVQSMEIPNVARNGSKTSFTIKICPPLNYSQSFALFHFRLALKDDPAIYDDAWIKITLNRPPVAKIRALTPINGTAPLTVQMDAFPSTDPDGEADMKTFAWDCTSDGTPDFTTTSKTAAVSCVYPAKNTPYNARLTLTDRFGAQSTDSIAIVTAANVPPQIPVISYSPQPTYPQQDTTFTATPTDPTKAPDPDGTITKYTWSFGDGSPAKDTTTNTVVHKYASKGTFFATVTVTDNDGATSTSANIAVVVANRPPNKPSLTALPTSGFVPLYVAFSATTTDPDGDPIVAWQWNFGDGNITMCNCPLIPHIYNTAATFSARVKAQDNDPVSPQWSDWSDPIGGIVAIQNSITAFRVNDTNAGQKTKVMVSCTDTTLTAALEIRDFRENLLKSWDRPCNGSWIEADYVFASSGIYEAGASIKDQKCSNCPKTVYFRAMPEAPELKVPDAGPLSAIAVLAAAMLLVGRKKKK